MAEIRTIDYKGFNFATGSGGSSGFLIFSGSLELGSDVSSITSYSGVGIEAIGSSESFLRFRTVPDELDIRASQFFVGTEASQFVSGSSGNIEISSSNFHLKPDGGLIIGGDTTINAALSANEIFVPAGTTGDTGTPSKAYISSSGGAKFAGDGSGNFKVIFASGSEDSVIGGLKINDDALSIGTSYRISSSTDAIDPASFISSSNFKVSADGRVTMSSGLISSDVTILGTVSANSIQTPVGASTPSSSITADGLATFRSASIAGFEVNTEEIKSVNESLRLKSGGQITGSQVLFTGGDIAGWEINPKSIKKINGDLNAYIMSDATGLSATHTAAEPAIILFNSSNFVMANMGNIYKNSDNTGFALFSNYVTNTKLFEISKNNTTDALTAIIAGWNIDEEKLSNTGVHLSASYGIKAFDATAANNDFVELKYKANDNFGIIGTSAGNTIFSLGKNQITGVANNQIAGWTFDNEKLTGGNIVINKEGSIKTNDYVSGLSGFALTGDSGSFLEVENAKIRGTLSTAVFEKETVNAVGGQLYVANSTTLTGSVIAGQTNEGGEFKPSDTTMSVVNVTGFEQGEILSLKKINATGFTTEYVLVNSSSRHDSNSATNFSGNLMLTRAYGAGISGDSSSLGDTPIGTAQSYSGSQVIVSTGKINTGFIRLNANPNDTATPYIDIVERTGSGIYDINLQARIGDLSGIEDNRFSDGVTGHGLYTQNGYFKGKIEVASIPQVPTVHPSYHYNFMAGTGSLILNQASSDVTNHSGSIINADQCWVSESNSITGDSAIQFVAGQNSRIELEDRSPYFPGGSAINIFSCSLAVWLKPENVSHTEPQIVWEGGGATNGFALYVSESVAWWSAWRASGNHTMAVSASIPSGEYSHIGATYSHGTGSIYVNGTKQATAIGSTEFNTLGVSFSGMTGIAATHNDSRIIHTNAAAQNTNALSGDGKAHYTGSMDELWVYWNKLLTDNDIAGLFLTPQGSTPGSTIIEGNRIKTGKIQSNNFDTSAGSIFDLDNGTFKMGGDSSPKLEFNGSTLSIDGTVTATAGNIGGFTIDAHSLTSTGVEINDSTQTLFISSSNFKVDHTGEITGSQVLFTGGTIGGFDLSTTEIKSDNNNLRLKANGDITASQLRAIGGRIGGFDISGARLKSTGNVNGLELHGANGFFVISSSGFMVDPVGNVSASSARFSGDILATNITENLVQVTDDNSGSFLRYVSGNAITGKKNLVCDGSLGGQITNNIEISTTAAFTIADIELANTGSVVANLDLFINTEGMHLSDGDGVILRLRDVLDTKDAPG